MALTCFISVGLCNPPGNVSFRELPWANTPTNLIPVEISWTAPRYTANLTSILYRLSYDPFQLTIINTTTTNSLVVYFYEYTVYTVTLEVDDYTFDGSDPIVTMTNEFDSECNLISK